MANLTEDAVYEEGIYQLETTDPCLAGEGGVLNTPHIQLANRTKYLKEHVDALESLGTDLTEAITSEAANRTAADNAITSSMGEIKFTRESTYNEDAGTNNLSAADIKGTMFNMVPNALGPTTLNLPSTGVNLGAIVGFRSFGTDNTNLAYVNRSGSDTIKFEQVGLTQLVLEPGDMYILCKTASGVWSVISHRVSDVGKVEAFARTTAPIGWLECNGQAVSRTTYANLFLWLGTRHGIGDNSTTFNVPDLRGEFIRGFDNGKGTDLNSVSITGTRTSGSAIITGITSTEFLFAGMTITGTGIPGGATIVSVDSSVQITISANATTSGAGSYTCAGRVLGSKQEDAFKLHDHDWATQANVVNGGSPTTAVIVDWETPGATQTSSNVQPVGGVETRPRNMALMYCIKF